MAHNNDNYTFKNYTLDNSQNDEIIEIERSEISNQETATISELTTIQPIPIKPHSKISWVWEYFVRKSNEKGEIRAYCCFEADNGEKCKKNYKYDGSTENLNGHLIKHGILPPISENSKSINPVYEQKEKEASILQWILLTTQPLSTVTNKAFIECMHNIDPQFIVPGERKIRMMIAQSYSYNKDKLIQLLKTAKSVSLTTDLWSSRSKHGYLGLTATWISQNFEIIDVLLEISYFPALHIAKAIANTIKKAIQKWKIENNIVSIVTDNGANMIAAIRELIPIKRLPCAAYTLQLAIRNGLKIVNTLTVCAKQLINFFSTQKQIERLIKVQKDIGYEEPLHLIQDVSTR